VMCPCDILLVDNTDTDQII